MTSNTYNTRFAIYLMVLTRLDGILGGATAALVFLLVHHVVMTPIWFVAPFALIFGALTGMALAWSYRELFDSWSITNFVKLFLIYLLPLALLDLAITIFVDPIYDVGELPDTGVLLGTAYAIVIPYSIIYGLFQGKVLPGDRQIIYASVATNFVIMAGIGHNFPLFALVSTTDNTILMTKIMAFGIIITLCTVFYLTLYFKYKISSPETSSLQD